MKTIGVIGTLGLFAIFFEGLEVADIDDNETDDASEESDDIKPVEELAPDFWACISSLFLRFSAMISENDFMVTSLGCSIC